MCSSDLAVKLEDVESNCANHQNTLTDGLPVSIDTSQLHTVGQNTQQQDTGEDPGESAFTAADTDTAQKDCGNDCEFRTRPDT